MRDVIRGEKCERAGGIVALACDRPVIVTQAGEEGVQRRRGQFGLTHDGSPRGPGRAHQRRKPSQEQSQLSVTARYGSEEAFEHRGQDAIPESLGIEQAH